MDNFSEVGLGFAEFVAQLLNETFDAVLSAQNYQLEQYAELEAAKNLSTERFFELYLDDDSLSQKGIDVFEMPLAPQATLTDTTIAIIEAIFETPKGIVSKKRLTINGYNKIRSYLLELLVEERKNIIDTLLNRTELARLVVDTGEINAKLELSNLYESTTTTNGTKKRTTGPTVPKPRNIAKPFANIPVKEYTDPETKKKTILIDKDSLTDEELIKNIIPSVRVTANPVKMSSSSNLYSEVRIKFKTI